MSNAAFIFLDIDGTIYTPRHGIPESTRKAIRLLKENGHHPVICTGRTRCMIFPAILELGFDGILGGAGAYGEWQGSVLFNTTIETGEATELIRCFRKNGFHAYAEARDWLFFDPFSGGDPNEEARRIFSLHDPDLLRPFEDHAEGIAKVSGIFTKQSDIEAFSKEQEGRYHVVNHAGFLLETFPAESSKGDAIRKLMDHLGTGLENTYAYGDSFNDLSMLETVNYGICMENGDPRLLEQIPLHAGRLEEDGLFLSLQEFGLI